MPKEFHEFPFTAPSVCTPSCAVAPNTNRTLVLVAVLQLACGYVARPRRSANVGVLLAVSALFSAWRPDSGLSGYGACVAASALLAELGCGLRHGYWSRLSIGVTSVQVFSTALSLPDTLMGMALRHPVLLLFTLARFLLRRLPPHMEEFGRRSADRICGARSCPPFPRTVEHLRRYLATELGRAWVERCLSGTGAAQVWTGSEHQVGQGRVAQCRVEPLAADSAAGCVGETARVWVTRDNGTAPFSVVVKFPPASFFFRHKTRAVGLQAAEAGFYAALCPGVSQPLPQLGSSAAAAGEHTRAADSPGGGRLVLRCPQPLAVFWDWMDDSGLLILEDMAPLRPGNQLRLLDDRLVVRSVLQRYAWFHGRFWADTELGLRDQVPWLRWYGWMSVFAHPAVCPVLWPRALAAMQADAGLRDLFSPAVLGVLRRVPAALRRALEWLRTRPCAVVHGDARLENMFFAQDASDFGVCDWQLVQRASPMFDVAYFLCLNVDSSVLVSLDDDRELVAGYCGGLWGSAPAARSWVLQEALLDYRVNVLLVAVMVVVSMNPSDRNLCSSGRQVEIRRVMLERALEAVARVDCAGICDMFSVQAF